MAFFYQVGPCFTPFKGISRYEVWSCGGYLENIYTQRKGIRTCIRAHTHTYTHTYIYIYIHIPNCIPLVYGAFTAKQAYFHGIPASIPPAPIPVYALDPCLRIVLLMAVVFTMSVVTQSFFNELRPQVDRPPVFATKSEPDTEGSRWQFLRVAHRG